MLRASHDISQRGCCVSDHAALLLAPRRRSSLAARRTGSTWTVFPSTLLLQLLSDCKISDRIRTEGGWFDVELKHFSPPLPGTRPNPPRFTFCPFPRARVVQERPEKCSPAGLPQSGIAAFPCVCVIVCAPTPHPLHPTLLFHHLHAHTYATRTHPAYWSVTMETERLLPNRGGEVMEAAEERRKWTSIHPPVHESVTKIIELTLFKRHYIWKAGWMHSEVILFIICWKTISTHNAFVSHLFASVRAQGFRLW